MNNSKTIKLNEQNIDITSFDVKKNPYAYNEKEYIMGSITNQFKESNLDELLIYGTQKNTSDFFFSTNDCVRADIYGKKYQLTSHRLNSNEMNQLIYKIYDGPTATAFLNSGKSINKMYIIKKIDENNKEIALRFRVNITTINSKDSRGYDITLRYIPNQPPELDRSDIPDELINLFHKSTGIILVAGATGSGKSTLLAGFIHYILKNPLLSKRILSYEQPIEFTYDVVPQKYSFIKQTEVPTMLPSFSDGLVESLRRKPDDIFIGEMRDIESITNACNAALTGHLVYSTLHSNDVSDTIKRISNLYPEGERQSVISDLLNTIQGIISQRLRPSEDGKRVAIREYLIFDEDIKTELMLETNINQLPLLLRKMVWERGVTFATHARQRFLEGKISEIVLREFAQPKDYEKLDKRIKELKESGNVMFQNNNL